MRKLLSLCFLFSIATSGFAQEEIVHPSKASLRYREYRYEMTEPSYGLAKVKAMIKKLKPDSDDAKKLTQKAYDSLSFEEKFTYTMIHGEDADQNCDAMPGIKDEEKKIFGYIPGNFGDEAMWSDRQRDFLKKNRTKVIGLLRKTIKSKQRIGVNLKHAIQEINAFELIPDMIAVYKVKRYDQDILTLFMEMMKEDNFGPFVKSQSYEKLYGEHSNYRGYIEANSANQKLVMERAMAYYNSKVK